MMVSKATEHAELLWTFEHLAETLATFLNHLHQEQTPLWIARSEAERQNGLTPREKALRLFGALWYEDGQDGRDTLTCPGLIGAGEKTLAAAQRCNEAKDEFKRAVLALKSLERSQNRAALDALHARATPVAEAMRHMGTARLNLKQAYRRIACLPFRPQKVGFTWSRQGRVIERLDVDTVRRLVLRSRNAAAREWALMRLAQLPIEEPLARVRSVCPHLRANVVYSNQRKLIQAPLPLLVPIDRDESLPEYIPVAIEPDERPRAKRCDVRIEEEPFLPAQRIYRYLPAYRNASTVSPPK